MTRRVIGLATALTVAVVVALAAFLWLFLDSSRMVAVAGHDAEVRPTTDRHVVMRTGPLLPDVRHPAAGPVGVEILLGKTEDGSSEALLQRYGFIAANPDAEVAKVDAAVRDMAVTAGLRAVGLGLLPIVVWLLLGPHRRGELWRGLRTRRGVVAGGLVLVVPVLLWQPWESSPATEDGSREWESLEEWLGLPVPAAAADLEVRTGPASSQARRLVESAVTTYETSLEFYDTAAADAEEIDVREAEEGETVALLVSDRHDNIGMDQVARAVADRAGVSAVLNAGDDTSTGQPWEAFSLDSVSRVFADLDRWAVAGNHDHGDFVPQQMADLGWDVLDGTVVEGPGGGTLLGVSDPRSSGLGTWRDETGLPYSEVGSRLADAACDHREESGEPVDTVLVHDWDLAEEALERGCARLVVGGHLHVANGPVEVEAPDGSVGHHWTNGTTGGAAYAIAVGSKPRRDASMTLVTYRDGEPVGVQLVTLRTDGRFVVGEYAALSR